MQAFELDEPETTTPAAYLQRFVLPAVLACRSGGRESAHARTPLTPSAWASPTGDMPETPLPPPRDGQPCATPATSFGSGGLSLAPSPLAPSSQRSASAPDDAPPLLCACGRAAPFSPVAVERRVLALEKTRADAAEAEAAGLRARLQAAERSAAAARAAWRGGEAAAVAPAAPPLIDTQQEQQLQQQLADALSRAAAAEAEAGALRGSLRDAESRLRAVGAAAAAAAETLRSPPTPPQGAPVRGAGQQQQRAERAQPLKPAPQPPSLDPAAAALAAAALRRAARLVPASAGAPRGGATARAGAEATG